MQLTASKWILNAGEDATLICSASGGYPLFHNMSLMKNGLTVVSEISDEIIINTSELPVEKFGVYKCLVNNSVAVTDVVADIQERGKANC